MNKKLLFFCLLSLFSSNVFCMNDEWLKEKMEQMPPQQIPRLTIATDIPGFNEKFFNQYNQSSDVMQSSYDQTVARLIARSMDIIEARDEDTLTALHRAVLSNNQPAIETLLWLQHKIDALDRYGKTPLHYAIDWNYLECALFLVKKGANIHMINKEQGKRVNDIIQNRLNEIDAKKNPKPADNARSPKKQKTLK